MIPLSEAIDFVARECEELVSIFTLKTYLVVRTLALVYGQTTDYVAAEVSRRATLFQDLRRRYGGR